MINDKNCEYGVGDTSYKMAGELSGITQLVDEFYLNMKTIKSAQQIRTMHPEDLSLSSKKLAYFLSGWLGGPKLYAEHFGGINIPMAHKHMSIGTAETEAWLLCMEKAIEKQNYEASFKTYLMQQLRIPAERIKQVASAQ